MTIFDALWSTGIRKIITSFAALVTGLSGAVVAAGPAWTALGLPVPASVEYVQEELGKIRLAQETTRSIAAAVRLQLVRDKRMRLADQVLRWKVELEKTTDPATRLIIAQQMQTLEIEKADAEVEIIELTRSGR